MNLTKGLRQTLVCAGIMTVSVAAYGAIPWVEDDFELTTSGAPQAGTKILGSLNTLQWRADGSDESTFETSAASGRDTYKGTTPMTNSTANFVMALNTEGATLIRDLKNSAGTVTVADFSSDPVYVDMMVKFVLSEDQPDAPTDGEVKTLIFANADSNLVVWSSAGYMPDFTVLNATVDPDQWYRLTLKWFVFDYTYAAFTIQLNGGAPITDSVGWGYEEDWSPGGPIYVSCETGFNDMEMKSIEFQGTGFIDELVVTPNKPDWGEGDTDVYFAGTGPKVDGPTYDAWQKVSANANSITAAGGVKEWMYDAYLLNVDPGSTGVKARLVIKSITPTSSGANITLGAIDGKGNPAAFAPIGVLHIYKSATLDGLPLAPEDKAYGLNAGVYSISGATTQYFFKAAVTDK